MGQCVLKDCGFEYQKTKVENGVPFVEFFKEVPENVFYCYFFLPFRQKIRAKKTAKLLSIDEKTIDNETSFYHRKKMINNPFLTQESKKRKKRTLMKQQKSIIFIRRNITTKKIAR